ncbi:MAG: nucleoside triphosphate pyrophosphohydrolase [Eggerthellaceae bacterium]
MADQPGTALERDASAYCEAPATAAERIANPQPHPDFEAFVATIAALRAPDGCPWDREQTHGSIAHNMIEEAYEAVDAIEALVSAEKVPSTAPSTASKLDSTRAVAHLREELGDVLLQVVLQSQIAEDAGEFTIDDVCADINAKMIRRHPHVFGSASADDASAVLGLWEQVKLAEKEAADDAADAAGGAREGLLNGVPTSFPALMQAQKISRKAVAAGFEWDTLDDVWAQVGEEIAELKEAYAAAPKGSKGKISVTGELPAGGGKTPEELVAAVELEFGDVLFALVNVARKMGVDGENALRATCAKFRSRWAHMERQAWAQGRAIEDLPTEEQERLWQQAKAAERR